MLPVLEMVRPMIDKTSGDWPGTKRFLEERREHYRRELESPTCMTKEADQHRGRIMMLTEIIETVEPPFAEPVRPVGYS